jgi:hypothetical protein
MNNALRRLIGLGIGAVLALGYWGVVAAMFAVAALFVLISMGPGIILVWLVVCACAWGFGLFLCVVAGLLTIAPQPRRAAVAFLIGSAAANVVLFAAAAVAFLVIVLVGSSA